MSEPDDDLRPIEDVLEQRRAITEDAEDPEEPEAADPGEVPFEADAADVWEQQVEVGPDDEEELRT